MAVDNNPGPIERAATYQELPTMKNAQTSARFVSHHVNQWEARGDKSGGRIDTLNVVEDDGNVQGIRVPRESVSMVSELAATAKIGDRLTLVVDVNAFSNGNRAVQSLTLVYVELAELATASK